MQSLNFIGTRNNATTTVQTFQRITAVHSGWVAFVAECFGIDPVGQKILVEVYRGSTGGTPGSNVAPKADDGEQAGLDPALSMTVADKFTNETAYAAGSKIDNFAVHPQYHRASRAYWLNAAEVLDVRCTVGATGANTGVQIVTKTRA